VPKVEQAVSPALSFCFSLPLPPAWQFPGPRGTWRGPRGQPGDHARDAPARGGDPAVLGGACGFCKYWGFAFLRFWGGGPGPEL